MDYPKERKLSGVFYRVERNNKFENIDFTDMIEEEMDAVLERYDREVLIRMCKILGKCIHDIGNYFDIECSEED